MVYHYTDQQFDANIKSVLNDQAQVQNKEHWKSLEAELLQLPRPSRLFDFSVNNIAKLLLVFIFSGALFTLMNFTPSIYASKKTQLRNPVYIMASLPLKESNKVESRIVANTKPFNEVKMEVSVNTEVKQDKEIAASSSTSISTPAKSYYTYKKKAVNKESNIVKPAEKETVDSYSDAVIPWGENQEQSLELSDVN